MPRATEDSCPLSVHVASQVLAMVTSGSLTGETLPLVSVHGLPCAMAASSIDAWAQSGNNFRSFYLGATLEARSCSWTSRHLAPAKSLLPSRSKHRRGHRLCLRGQRPGEATHGTEPSCRSWKVGLTCLFGVSPNPTSPGTSLFVHPPVPPSPHTASSSGCTRP